MRIQKLNMPNLRPLERELDRIGFEKYDIVPYDPYMPSLDDLGLEDEDDEDEY